MRLIVDVPRLFVRISAIDWAIDWRTQSSGGDLAGGDQTVFNAFPRWVGTLPLVLPKPMIAAFRAIIWQAEGSKNALRVPMVDPVSFQSGGATWKNHWQAYLAGSYSEPRPKVVAVSAAAAGDSSVVVDERPLRRPVAIGQILSFNDWPFAVVGKSGPESARVLAVKRLATSIPVGGQIDLAATGLFLLPDATAGQPTYGLVGPGTADLSLREWITR